MFALLTECCHIVRPSGSPKLRIFERECTPSPASGCRIKHIRNEVHVAKGSESAGGTTGNTESNSARRPPHQYRQTPAENRSQYPPDPPSYPPEIHPRSLTKPLTIPIN